MRLHGKTPVIYFRSRWYMVCHGLILAPIIFGVVYGLRIDAVFILLGMPSDNQLTVISTVVILVLYYGVHYASKALLARRFRQGVRLLKKGKYQEAIPVFEAAFTYFNRYPWLDRYRVLFLFSTSAISYREMCLLNMAYCHHQTGGANKSEALYREALRINPDNLLAQNALKMIETFAGK